jgi:NifB/MoaA-like Fe-S oxidoreductase
MDNVITNVEPGGIAAEMGIEPGDVLISINDKPVKDVFDYRYLIADEELSLVVRKPNG